MQPRKKVIPTVLPAFLCLLGLLIAACGGSSTPSTVHIKASADKQIFILPEAGVPDIATFDPGLSTDVYSINAINLVFTGLVQPDDNGNTNSPARTQHRSTGRRRMRSFVMSEFGDEFGVGTGAADQFADLLAALRAGVGGENAVRFG